MNPSVRPPTTRHRRRWFFATTIPMLLMAILAMSTDSSAQSTETRMPEQWPFAWDSIWNMPLGVDAEYVPAGIAPTGEWGMTVDEDIVILEPDAPLVPIGRHDAGWSDRLRCESIIAGAAPIEIGVPIPESFSTDPGYDGTKPNMSAAILRADGETIAQTQPFHRCGPGGPAISQDEFADDNIVTGDGRLGAHGGSGLSSLGGTLRVGELVPGATIRHALKVNIFAGDNLTRDWNDPTPGYRWPAANADAYAWIDGRYGGTNPALEMGALLALRPDFDLSTLETEPARILARAFRDYGAYIADDTAWDVWGIETEWGPNGRVRDEFTSTWGFPLSTPTNPDSCDPAADTCRWVTDMRTIFTNLHVIDDNGPDNIGGAGDRRVPCAPPFADGSGAVPDGACPVVGDPPVEPTPTPTPVVEPTPTPTPEPTSCVPRGNSKKWQCPSE